MSWQPSHDAPRDKPVWLFLPAASYTRNANGTVTDVTHAVVVAKWDAGAFAWVESGNGKQVFPSMWHDAPVDGTAPDHPKLAD